MVLKLEHILGSKNSVAILRYLIQKNYLSFGLSELSEVLNISKSNILRVLNPLINERLVIEQKTGRKKLIKANSESELIKELWKVFMIERKSFIAPDFKNAIDLFFSKIKEKAEVFILFGSVAQGRATEKSDIDILIVGDKKLSGPVLDYLPFRFEVHNYSLADLKEKKDFVVLEALMNGIIYKGELFDTIKELKFFSKYYIIYRLNKAKEFLMKKSSKDYYQRLADITVGEIEYLLKKKQILPKGKIKTTSSLEKIKKLEEQIAKEGEQIWLI